MGGTTLPSYQSGKYLTTNGSSLSWDDPDNNYVTGASWSSSTGQLTLTRGGSSSLSNVTANVSNLVTYLNANLSGGNPSIQTDTGNANHNLVFVDQISNTSQQLKIDNADWSLCYNPSSNRLIAQDCCSFHLSDWDGERGDSGQMIVSKASNHWEWSSSYMDMKSASTNGGVEVESDGEFLIKKAGPTSGNGNLEGGHIQFMSRNNSTKNYAIDVYSNNGTEEKAVIRIIDQTSGMQRFCVNKYGAFGIGHTAPDYGGTGKVMISRGEGQPPYWGTHTNISGSAFATTAQGATADTANADIDNIYTQLNAIGNDASITTVAQLKAALAALTR